MAFLNKPAPVWIPLGTHDVDVEIALNSPVTVSRFDLRFIDTPAGGNTSPDIIEILDGFDHAVYGSFDRGNPTEFSRAYDSVVERKDILGGNRQFIDFHYVPLRPMRQNEAIRLQLKVKAWTEWRGYLGFRGHDAEGNPRLCAVPVTVEALQAPEIEDFQR